MTDTRPRQPILIFLVFSLGSLVLSYPLILRPLDHIPLGSERSGTVPLFNLWTLQWNIDQLLQGYPGYWDAPIFAPASGTFAFSETQPLSALLAAPVWLGSGSPALAYNALVILFLTLNGWFAYWLLRSWGLPSWPSLLAGLLTQALPFVAQERGVLQLMALFGPLWSLLFLHRFLARAGSASWRNGLGLALGSPVTFFTCAYYGLFSLLFLPLALLFHLRRRHLTWSTAGRLAIIGLLALALSGPFLLAQRRRLQTYGFARSEKTITNQSARPENYTFFLDDNLLYGRFLGRQSGQGQRLFPGLGLTALALAGLAGRRQKRLRAYLALAAVLAFALSLGLRLNLAGFAPYQLLRHYVPGFAQLRSPFRFAAFAQLHLALLAGFGLHHLGIISSKMPVAFQGVRNEFRTPLRKNANNLALALVASFAIFETLALPLPLLEVPPPPDAAWQTWLKEQPSPLAVVLVPFARSGRVADFEQTTRWMLAGRYFQAAMLNGYSGFFPPYHSRLRESMLAFPSADSLTLLREKGADYVVVHHRLPDAPPAPVVEQHLRLLYRDEKEGVAIYGWKPGAD